MSKVFNWGIIGLGKIAHKFAEDLQLLKNARLHAVASRSPDRAAEFAKQYQVQHAYGSYQEMLNCPDLDVVYIATPHISHCENSIMCLEHQIPVLCEKPFAMFCLPAGLRRAGGIDGSEPELRDESARGCCKNYFNA